MSYFAEITPWTNDTVSTETVIRALAVPGQSLGNGIALSMTYTIENLGSVPVTLRAVNSSGTYLSPALYEAVAQPGGEASITIQRSELHKKWQCSAFSADASSQPIRKREDVDRD